MLVQISVEWSNQDMNIGLFGREPDLALVLTKGREPDLALVLTKAKKFSLWFLFSLTIGT